MSLDLIYSGLSALIPLANDGHVPVELLTGPTKKVLISLAALGLLGTALLFGLLSGAASPIINLYLDQISDQIFQHTQRKVKIDSVDVRVFPQLVFEVNQTQLNDLALPQEVQSNRKDDTFLYLDQLRIQFNTWKALVSLGKNLELDQMTIENVPRIAARPSQKIGK